MPTSKLDYLRFPFRAGKIVAWGMRPLDELCDHCRPSQEARAVIAAQSGDYATPPSLTLVALHAGLLDHCFQQDGGSGKPRHEPVKRQQRRPSPGLASGTL